VDGVSAVVSDVVVAASVVAVVVVVVSFVVVVACSGLLCDVTVDVIATRAGATFVSLLDDDDATEFPFGEFVFGPPRLCGEATARTRKVLGCKHLTLGAVEAQSEERIHEGGIVVVC